MHQKHDRAYHRLYSEPALVEDLAGMRQPTSAPSSLYPLVPRSGLTSLGCAII
ncbi:MAG: hypothetical protein P8163_21860 [Candidatus Thiodiazotropha sp.]